VLAALLGIDLADPADTDDVAVVAGRDSRVRH